MSNPGISDVNEPNLIETIYWRLDVTITSEPNRRLLDNAQTGPAVIRIIGIFSSGTPSYDQNWNFVISRKAHFVRVESIDSRDYCEQRQHYVRVSKYLCPFVLFVRKNQFFVIDSAYCRGIEALAAESSEINCLKAGSPLKNVTADRRQKGRSLISSIHSTVRHLPRASVSSVTCHPFYKNTISPFAAL